MLAKNIIKYLKKCFFILIILILFFASCSVFSRKIELLDYSSFDISKIENPNKLATVGIKIKIPEEWMYLPPEMDNELFRFISSDGTQTGLMELIAEETVTDESDENADESTNDDTTNNNDTDESTNDDTTNNNNADESTNDDTTNNNNADESTNDDANSENDINNENEDKVDTEEQVVIKPLDEYLEELLETKTDYRFVWYIKRFDTAKAYMTKVINTNANFVYYSYFIDERSPKRVFRLTMIEENLNKPEAESGTTLAASVPTEDAEEMNESFLSIFSSVDLNEEKTLLDKYRYNIGVKTDLNIWSPVLDDTNQNVLKYLHNSNDAFIHMRKLGYKHSEDKNIIINAKIENFKENNTSYSYTENEIEINALKAKVLQVEGYKTDFFKDKSLSLRKIYFIYNEEIFEIGVLFNNKNSAITQDLVNFFNGIYFDE